MSVSARSAALVALVVAVSVPPVLAAPAKPAANKPAATKGLSMAEANALFQRASGRVEVASSDGTQVLITNAFTLERRKVAELPQVVSLAFAPDGSQLHAVTATGAWHAIDPDKATVRLLGNLPLQDGEVVVHSEGATVAGGDALIVHVHSGPALVLGQCADAGLRVLQVQRVGSGAVSGQPHNPKARPQRLAAGSPNTRYSAAVQGSNLTLSGHFGAGSGKANTSPVPAGLFRISWLRDSSGLTGLFSRPGKEACKHRLGSRFWLRGSGGWQEWTVPDDAELVRGDIADVEPELAADNQRLIAWTADGIYLAEPVVRFRGHLAKIAPPSVVLPRVRPGLRPLATRLQGFGRLVEHIAEMGDLDLAEAQLATLPPTDKQRISLSARVAKLREVRARRAKEWQLAESELRSDKGAEGYVPESDAGPVPALSPKAGPEPEPRSGP